MKLDAAYWSQRYRDDQTGWDIGAAAPQLMVLATELPKDARILIPGCGKAWEAEALFRLGHTQVHVCDWSAEALKAFHQRCPDFPRAHLLEADFFQLHDHGLPAFDCILEQTFFCAIPPDRRDAYAEQSARLLTDGGKLGGLLFDFPLTSDGPPFGGDHEAYRSHFEPFFEVLLLETSKLSIKPREKRELAFLLQKKAESK